MNKPILIFDFDGTIADTHHYIIEIANRLSTEFHYRKIRPEEVDQLKNKTSQEIMRYLKVPLLKIPAIISRAKKEFRLDIAHLEPFEGLKDILHTLKKQGVKTGILSSNAYDNVMHFLKNHGLDMFDFVHTTSKVWSKNTSLKKVIQSHGFSMDQILYIGDEIRDIVMAKKLGIKIAAVTWGYNSAEALKTHQPDFILDTPDQIFEIFESVNP